MFMGLSATTAEMDCCHNALPTGEAVLLQLLVLICTALGLLHSDAVQLTMLFCGPSTGARQTVQPPLETDIPAAASLPSHLLTGQLARWIVQR